MAIPYQQGYSISPRYGFRYGPSSHVPATTDRYVIPDNNYIPPPSSGTSTSGGASKQPLTMGTGSDEGGDDNTFTQNDSMAKSLAKNSGYSPSEVNPLAGALNNITFSQSALGAAGSGLNYKLITDNPKIDIFYYPKYEISNKVNFWTQKAYLKANVKGAKQIIE